MKGNTHVHTTASDGGKSFAELAEMYSGRGYHFLFRTDHWAFSDVQADTSSYPLLWLDGVEVDGRDATGSAYHIVFLGSTRGIAREMGLEVAIAAAVKDGAMLVLAHPHWMGNTLEEASFQIQDEWSYAYLEIEDECGRRAWTNPLFHSQS